MRWFHVEPTDVSLPFIFTVTVGSGQSFQLPTVSTGTYDAIIEWGDTTSNALTVWNAAGRSHTYTTGGTYEIKITGVFTGWSVLNYADRLKITEVKQWGNLRISADSAFQGCSNLTITAPDILDTSEETTMQRWFFGCTAITTVPNMEQWDVSSVQSMVQTFYLAQNFNHPIGDWDVSSVTSMNQMFVVARRFNQNIGSWNVSNVTNMVGMFSVCNDFNNGGSPDINNWNTSNVTAFCSVNFGTFRQAPSFNQPIGNWDISGATSLQQMFQQATAFNQDIGGWDTSNVTNMVATFNLATNFNQDISGWDVSNVSLFTTMFQSTPNFDQNLGLWDTSGATNMQAMFAASVFNNGGSDSIKNWDVSNVTIFGNTNAGMFRSNSAFNQPIGDWNVSSGQNFSQMFSLASGFNQDISGWDVSSGNNFIGFMEGKTPANYSTTHLDALYNGWALLTLNPNIDISFGTIKYTAAGTAGRNVLTGAPNNWTITDGGI